MKNNPLVSVVVITYQHVNYIRQCLDNILTQQTDFDFEIIVGEDESSDGTREICIEYANLYPDKIRLFLRSRNDVLYINDKPTGRYNFIECLKEAKGKYIAFCEGDDYWIDLLKLQKQFDFLETNSDYTIVASNSLVIDKNKEVIKEIKTPSHTFLLQNMIKANFLGHSSNTVMFRSSILTPEAIEVIRPSPLGDWIIWQMLLQSGKGFYMQDVTGVYRMHGQGIWSSNTAKDRIKVMLSMYDYMSSVMPQHADEIANAKGIYLKEAELKKIKKKESILHKIYYRIFH